MPRYRVRGHVCINFIHTIEADSRRGAEEHVENMCLFDSDKELTSDFDKELISEGDNTIYDVVELDEFGNVVPEETGTGSDQG